MEMEGEGHCVDGGWGGPSCLSCTLLVGVWLAASLSPPSARLGSARAWIRGHCMSVRHPAPSSSGEGGGAGERRYGTVEHAMINRWIPPNRMSARTGRAGKRMSEVLSCTRGEPRRQERRERRDETGRVVRPEMDPRCCTVQYSTARCCATLCRDRLNHHATILSDPIGEVQHCTARCILSDPPPRPPRLRHFRPMSASASVRPANFAQREGKPVLYRTVL